MWFCFGFISVSGFGFMVAAYLRSCGCSMIFGSCGCFEFVVVCWFDAFLSRLVDFVVAVCLWWVVGLLVFACCLLF